MARKYQKAGSRLLKSLEGDTADAERALSDPLYFLDAHALELAFKAFLLSQGETISRSGKPGHDIVGLHRRCEGSRKIPIRSLGVVKMLATENEHHEFLYFDPVKGHNGVMPALPWTGNVVDALFGAIREQLGDRAPAGRVKVQFIAGKPTTTTGR